MNQLQKEVKQELIEHIIPFWLKLKDDDFGSFYGEVDFDLNVNKFGEKGGIATSRILWSFSALYKVLKDEKYLECAKHTYKFFKEKLYDYEKEGIYWMLNYDGSPKDTKKHIYAQAFGIYALSEYYRITRDREALDLAIRLYNVIETKGFDPQSQAYGEEYDRDWVKTENIELSENNIIAEITTNTHLHVLEAYTNLYDVWKDAGLKENLKKLVDTFYTKIYDHDTHFLKVFFDKDWKVLIDLQSYGHDIEASWLLDRALDVLDMHEDRYDKMVVDIAENIGKKAINEDGSLAEECENGVVKNNRVWWCQAEAIVGFINAYQKTGKEEYLKTAERLWDYTKEYIVDRRENGEWLWAVDKDNLPVKREISGPWKTPYHNARFCLEIMTRDF